MPQQKQHVGIGNYSAGELSIGRNSSEDEKDLTAIKRVEGNNSSLGDIDGMQIGSVMLTE